jgi:hypothetical protein
MEKSLEGLLLNLQIADSDQSVRVNRLLTSKVVPRLVELSSSARGAQMQEHALKILCDVVVFNNDTCKSILKANPRYCKVLSEVRKLDLVY